MKNAVIYARYSSDKQTELSIDAQLTACYHYAKEQKLKIVGEYIDRAFSGKNDNRPEFKHMIKDSEKKEFEYVLVYKLDRFARNRYDSAINKKALRNNNVKVLSAMEHLTDTPESILMESMLEGYAEYYSAELAQKIKNNRTELLKQKGRSLGGYTPYGYKIVDKFYQIDEVEAKNVREIFNEFSKGCSISKILELMNIYGIKTGGRCRYTEKTIHRFLSNRRYIGIYETDNVIIEDYFPALIEKGVFYKVQENLKQRSKGKYNFATYLLSGKLFCGHCGEVMYGDSARGSKGKTYYYYTCSKNKNRKGEKCAKTSISKELLENTVVDATLNYIFSPTRFPEVVNKLKTIVEEENKKENKIPQIKRNLQNIENQIQNIVEAVKNGNSNKALLNELTNLENQQEEIKQQLSKEEYLQKMKLTPEKIEFMLEKIKNEKDSALQAKIILKSFVNYVALSNDKIEIGYNLSEDDVETICLKRKKTNSGGNSSNDSEYEIISSTSTDGSPILVL